MGYKFYDEKGYGIAWFSKRHPVTGEPITLRRKVKEKSKLKAVERELMVEVESRFMSKIVPLWIDLLEKYFTSMTEKGLLPKTVYNARLCLEASTSKWFDTFVTEISTQQIRDVILQDYGNHSVGHQKNLLKFIKQVFEFAVENEWVNRNPTPKLAFRVGDKIKKVLTSEQVKTFLNAAKDLQSPWYPLWTTALYTGMRNGELYALRWSKVNLADRSILVDCAWNNKDGFKDTKSGDDRVVEIAPNLLAILQELKVARVTKSDFVLPRLSYWDKGLQAKELRKFLIGIGLPTIRFHDLRATWATILLSKGIAPAKVMVMGGWKDLKTMMIYMRKSGIEIKGITNSLDLHNPKLEVGKVLDFSKM